MGQPCLTPRFKKKQNKKKKPRRGAITELDRAITITVKHFNTFAQNITGAGLVT